LSWYDVDESSLAQARRVLDGAEIAEGDTVLDVGAGVGLLTFDAHERVGDGWVIAVDPSVDALEELLRRAHEREAGGIMYLVGEAGALPLPDASVDVVVLRSVLVHVEDVRAAVAEFARVLRPAGRVSLREPLNRDGTYLSTAIDWGELDGRVKEVWASIDDPLQRLDADTLRAAFEGWADVAIDVEDPGDEWHVTRESAHARLDATGAPGQPSLRERWEQAFTPEEVQTLVARLESLAGGTVTFRRPEAYVTARRI
jgi:SAM-dependent methyltransferase